MGGEYQNYMQDIQIQGCFFFDGRNSVADGKQKASNKCSRTTKISTQDQIT